MLLLVFISVAKYLIYVHEGDTAQEKCQRFLHPASMSTTDVWRGMTYC